MNANVGTMDRGLRIVIGLGLLLATWTGTIGAWGWIGLVPLVTGVIGSCPAYSLLGWKTCSMPKRT